MQVILSEDEYLKLKNQHDEQKKAYVKRIDVSMALEELLKDLFGTQRRYDPITFEPVTERWKPAFDRFWERIENK
jgi:hypothetical protein